MEQDVEGCGRLILCLGWEGEVEAALERWEQAGLVGDSALGMLNQATWGHLGAC